MNYYSYHSADLVIIPQDYLEFQIDKQLSTSEATISISNNSDKIAAYKLKLSSPKDFIIANPENVIQPMNTIVITIKYKFSEVSYYKIHKFLLQIASSEDKAKINWKSNEVHEYKFSANFIEKKDILAENHPNFSANIPIMHLVENPNRNHVENPNRNHVENPDENLVENPDKNHVKNPDENLVEIPAQNLGENIAKNFAQNLAKNPVENLVSENFIENLHGRPPELLVENLEKEPLKNPFENSVAHSAKNSVENSVENSMKFLAKSLPKKSLGRNSEIHNNNQVPIQSRAQKSKIIDLANNADIIITNNRRGTQDILGQIFSKNFNCIHMALFFVLGLIFGYLIFEIIIF